MVYKIKFSTNSYTDDEYFFVSGEDYDKVSQYNWRVKCTETGHLTIARTASKLEIFQGYTHIIPVYRFILGCIKKEKVIIDHKNGNFLDNTRENLRKCTASQNSMNQKLSIRNTSGYKGVSWTKNRNKFKASIGLKGKLIYLGYFKCPIQAAIKYDKAVINYFGEFANTNFPMENYIEDI